MFGIAAAGCFCVMHFVSALLARSGVVLPLQLFTLNHSSCV